MKRKNVLVPILVTIMWLVVGAASADAQVPDNEHMKAPDNEHMSGCSALPSWSELKAALTAAVAQNNGFLKNNMWGTIVDRDGVVCAVAFTGEDRTKQWPASRLLSAQKANTANLFSLPAGSSGAVPNGL